MVRYSEVLSALSFALDMVEGQPQGHIIRTCSIGMMVGRRLGLTDEQRSALFYALLIKDAGCSSNASKMAALFDADDREAKRAFRALDWSRLLHVALYAVRAVSPNRPVWTKARRLWGFGLRGRKAMQGISRSAASGARRSRVS